MEEIRNRVAESKLVTLDLEDLYPVGERVGLDISDWLYEGLILREKDFRERADTYNWEQYRDKYVAIYCSSDTILPAWAIMFLSTRLQGIAKKVVAGDFKMLETVIFQDLIRDFDVSQYENKPVIVKGCSKKPVPENAYLQLLAKLQPVAKSIMYGEACSSVPLVKRK
ncbi:DUF2480 family protein [Robertkochia solimangrovi]|uniref:DUF2480 family protein n=1 Tax=Robertkochia solimangrovi TaxID=2213046 RepID=UPI0011810B4E|nr:DUF2480 family protein [Robertkochia solimangrovi]TRZ45966.1 hypothetical protein DMZ48_01450 [Robertkochia solimangrovi]